MTGLSTAQGIFIANAGILLGSGGVRILADALGTDTPPYSGTRPETLQAMFAREAPFGQVQILLITHDHPDHFSAALVRRFLTAHAETAVFTTGQTAAALRPLLSGADAGRVTALPAEIGLRTPFFGQGGVRLSSFGMRHDGAPYAEVENLGFFIELGGARVFLTGDAAACSENYSAFLQKFEPPDLLAAPFPYVARASSQAVVAREIRPKRIAALHLPEEQNDANGWARAAQRAVQRAGAGFPPVVFLRKAGDQLPLA